MKKANEPFEIGGVYLCDLCGTIERPDIIEPLDLHCRYCVVGNVGYWTGDQINSKLKALDEVMSERDKALAQIVHWRGTIRETGYDGAREIVDAYKARTAEIQEHRESAAQLAKDIRFWKRQNKTLRSHLAAARQLSMDAWGLVARLARPLTDEEYDAAGGCLFREDFEEIMTARMESTNGPENQ